MAYLSLSEDELALLRFTCDLFFVEESPLFYLEASAREPADYETAYQSLIAKDVIDPHGFRVTDDALNRLAPLTECDARLVHIRQHKDGAVEQTDYWMLDEISVELLRGDGILAVGPDLDPDELAEHLARRLLPRKARGDRLDLTLTTTEMLALATLAAASSPERGFAVPEREARALLADARLTGAPRVSKPVALSPIGIRAADPLIGEATTVIDLAESLAGLIHKEAIFVGDGTVRPRPALIALLEGIRAGERHTFVRYDFGDDAWLTRESTFFVTDGGLFSLRLESEDDIRLEEIDGPRLKQALTRAVGPLPRDQRAPEPRPLRDLLLGFARAPLASDG